MPKLFTLSDIARRWNVTKQYVSKLYKTDENFPKPIQFVHKGTIPLFIESDILEYEPTKNLPKTK